MDYINLGRSGLKVSRICLGCMSYGDPARGFEGWSIDEATSGIYFRQALDAGINFFDTANIYSGGSSEEVTGRALRSLARREEIVIATKAFFPWRNAPNTGFLSRKALLQAIDDSLVRLGLDYVDLYQVHRFDHATPIEETMEALHDIVKAGKVRYLGASSMEAWRFAKMQHVAERNGWTRFVSMQPHYNLLYREEEREMLPLCIDQGVGVIPWGPLGGGKLTRDWDVETDRSLQDTYARVGWAATEQQDRAIVEAVKQLAADLGISRAQVAVAWALSKPAVTAPIVGATKPAHLADAIAAMEVRLTDTQISALEAPYVPHAVTDMVPPMGSGRPKLSLVKG